MIGMAEFTDISGIFASGAQMIAECKGNVYGYLRVSTAAQKHDRQLEAMRELGVRRECMFFDKQSGKDFNRPGYQQLLGRLKENDLLVIKNIDRLGRNTKEVKEQWRILTQEKRVSIVVIDTPVLNAGKELGPLGQALSDIIFAIFSMVADFDRQSIFQRLQEGLRVAMRERGVRPGRKAKAVPEGFRELKQAYENGEVSQRRAAKQLGVDRKTFRKWLGMENKRTRKEEKTKGRETEGEGKEEAKERGFEESGFEENVKEKAKEIVLKENRKEKESVEKESKETVFKENIREKEIGFEESVRKESEENGKEEVKEIVFEENGRNETKEVCLEKNAMIEAGTETEDEKKCFMERDELRKESVKQKIYKKGNPHKECMQENTGRSEQENTGKKRMQSIKQTGKSKKWG